MMGELFMRYVAFVRGINVGGKTVKMAELRKMFGSLGFKDVATYKASGNVVFDGAGSALSITKKIEDGLHKLIGKETRVILRTMDEVKRIVASDPFKGAKSTAGTRLYVTFLPENARTKMKDHSDGFYKMRVSGSEIFFTLMPSAVTVDIMEMLDKEFGKVVTTRNWNTILGLTES